MSFVSLSSSVLNLPSFTSDLMKILIKSGFTKPILYGGALRDSYLSLPATDYDIQASFPECSGEALKERISEIYGLKRVVSIGDHHALFMWFGNLVHLTKKPSDKLDHALSMSDAPINTVGVNEDGEVRAHCLFVTHAEQRVYAPYDSALQRGLVDRFYHLKEKITDLQFMVTSSFSPSDEAPKKWIVLGEYPTEKTFKEKKEELIFGKGEEAVQVSREAIALRTRRKPQVFESKSLC